ncbi:hypothetical protein [Nannocystis pusilla]|uniref:hypothetical protein n=1 Tax=Nannocystis pusilla TaxID=889268 RepID=UPI003B79A18E
MTRTISSPAMAAENPFLRAAQAQIEAWEAELATQPDLFRAARLSYEIGRLYEYPLGDVAQASTYYLRAHGLAPEFLPVVRGARARCWRRRTGRARCRCSTPRSG